MNYLENEQIKKLLDSAFSYRKKEKTALRLPFPFEIGQEIVTYVAHEKSIRVESRSIINSDSVIARNPQILAIKDNVDIYNEWPIEKKVVINNYGQTAYNSLTSQFSLHSKIKTLRAIILNQEVLDILNIKGDILFIDVSWSKEPMQALIGDYLTDGGYSISQEDMRSYEIVI